MTKISNSGHDENGRYSGGAAGDQTGGEWQIQDWYNRPWNCVLRHPDPKVRKLIAELAVEAANNDRIGYDQGYGVRDTFWQQLKKSGYHPKKIRVNCETDCSAGTIAITKAVGYLLGINSLKNLAASYTGDMRQGYKVAGFYVLTSSKYLASSEYLLAGDIILNDGHHVAVNITNGSKSGADSTPSSSGSGSTSGGSGTTLNRKEKFKGTVTTDLYVRTWAGKENPKCSFGPLKEGTKISVCDTVKADDGTPWYYISYKGKYGFVNSKYVKK